MSTPYTIQAATQAKAGTKCVKKNTTQIVNRMKFTCIKSGSKLVWNKGVVVVPQAVPSPAPSPSATTVVEVKPNPFDLSPFPDEFSRAQMVEAVLKDFNIFIKKKSSINSYKLVIDPKYESDSIAITKFTNDIYAVLPFPPDYPRTVVVVGNDLDLLESSIESYGGFDRTGSNQWDWRIAINAAGLGWAGVIHGDNSDLPHEIFHIWQKAAYKRVNDNSPDPSNSLNPPVWFDEGGATFFGDAMYSKKTNIYSSPRISWQPFRLEDYSTRNISASLPYFLGRVACEYIVASKGLDKFLEIYWNVGNGQDFPSAFNNALGISLEKFYEKFDKNLKNML